MLFGECGVRDLREHRMWDNGGNCSPPRKVVAVKIGNGEKMTAYYQNETIAVIYHPSRLPVIRRTLNI